MSDESAASTLFGCASYVVLVLLKIIVFQWAFPKLGIDPHLYWPCFWLFLLA